MTDEEMLLLDAIAWHAEAKVVLLKDSNDEDRGFENEMHPGDGSEEPCNVMLETDALLPTVVNVDGPLMETTPPLPLNTMFLTMPPPEIATTAAPFIVNPTTVAPLLTFSVPASCLRLVTVPPLSTAAPAFIIKVPTDPPYMVSDPIAGGVTAMVNEVTDAPLYTVTVPVCCIKFVTVLEI